MEPELSRPTGSCIAETDLMSFGSWLRLLLIFL